MSLPRENRFDEIAPLLPKVEKPARYLGHEWGSTEPDEDAFHVCMVFPDVYEIGVPNLGVAILYRALNRTPGLSCERCYLPWPDMADAMRAASVPLLSLESASPVASFGMVGVSIAHELAGTNVVEALDLARIPVRACDRAEDDAIVVAGGPGIWNPEPLAPMFDAFLLGEGEEHIVEVAEAIKAGREAGLPRAQIVASLVDVPGTYVPSAYEVRRDGEGTRFGYVVPREGSGAPEVVLRRVADDFRASDPCAGTIVPSLETVQDRLSVEVLRGCARGCRFCQAGITYRPVRERDADDVVAACVEGLARTGYDEVSLMSLSTTDHSQCARILHRLNRCFEDEAVRVSIPSQRLDSFGVEMALEVSGAKRGGLTFAPEAGSQRLRDVINKNVTEEDLERAARNAFENGWQRMKLYFMMGLPTETDDDIRAIPRLAERVLAIGREIVPKGRRGSLSVSVSVAVFVPKAHTPFQWCGQLPIEEVRRRQALLLETVSDRAVRVSYHDADTSMLEAALSKMGREGFDLIYGAWRRGCRFDAWTDRFRFDGWCDAAGELGIDLAATAAEELPLDARLPWDHASPGVSKGFLKREWRRALQGKTTGDCTRESCTGCGICPTLGVENVLAGER
ncbi:TIGR03960 family B12-binding radical SAM protein [Caniella muris]|uniref:TIGR03960 family B12-binding radical SAM protein n=1 Tax=Caniella muris TaxID=2941502 RepID=UPI00204123EE|nr:TIGR03960 family B12-binding radical SAM protein [Caniella muris]